MGCHCWETKVYSNERFLDLDNELERCAMDFEAKIFSDWKDAFMITVREKIRVGWESTWALREKKESDKLQGKLGKE